MKIKPITILLFFLLCIPVQMLAQKNDAPAYIGAAKIYYNRRDKEKILEMTRKALAEPNLIGVNAVDAWSYRCLAAMIPEGADHKAEYNKAYDEWKKAKEKYKANSSFNDLIEIYHAQVNGDYQQMLELAQTVRNTQDIYRLYPMLTNGWATGKNRCN